MNSCRNYNNLLKADIYWKDKFNEGPTIAEALSLEKYMYIRFAKLNNHEIAYQSTKAQLISNNKQ
ncbi:MAG: hypothetical protein EP298_06240 [Gammaproteobacteria bacterium]|nr:MAG: hypothetical protein EP298_06240 [Gammaproteobacteria bacterium]UTW41560.1 hypothetical protein KFE69_08565 [bacterium SCSIO 12844]